MQTIIHDTTIVTADEPCTVHYDAALSIADDRIAALGPNAELLARYPAAERIEGRGKAVIMQALPTCTPTLASPSPVAS
jgi:5-methylthioadenosine/S-adenosylhomocysteine deaminase